jgi:hypothetical protein
MEITTSEDGESLFEAYHSIFSKLVSTDYIYKELADNCGADFKYTRHASKIIQPNTIYCKKTKASAHYIYCNPEGEKEDPYDFYQLPMSEGNCFAYALYLASKTNHKNAPLPALVETHDLMDPTLTYKKVADDPTIKQRAYQTFVFNDFAIIQWLTDLIVKTKMLPDVEHEWEQLPEDEREYYGIPQAMTFSDYWANWIRYSSNIQYTYLMTQDQITNWDANVEEDDFFRLHPERNSGIEHSETIDLDQFVLPSSSVGGKRSRFKKSTSKKSRTNVRTYKKRNI